MEVKPAVSLRPFQQEFIDVALHKARMGGAEDKVVVADVHPGSGKTLACLAAADALFSDGHIEAVAVFVPRRNLAVQFEQDWREFRSNLPWPTTMRGIFHSDNNPPLFLENASGYVTTYDSLVSNPRLHLSEISKRPTLVVFDEAQQLGADYDGEHTVEAVTESARWAEKIGEAARMIFVLSGTPFRADGSRLMFARYGDQDETGFAPLKPDVRATYRDGVRDGYLRPFEAVLHDGRAIWKDFGADPEELVLSELGRAAYRVICHPGYWQPMVDRFIQHLADQKRLVDRRLCGLIAANTQAHAKQVIAYIAKRHPEVQSLLAVSDDGSSAHENLRTFREGNHDVLVTVSMAYVGYDHKPINSILVLTSIRTEGYLRQLLARGLRMWSQVETEKQTCFAFVPDDRLMREFVDALRSESKQGAQQREETLTVERDSPLSQPELGLALSAWLTEIRARGINPAGDMTPEEYALALRIAKSLNLPYPASSLIAFARAFGQNGGEDSAAPAPEPSNGGPHPPSKYITVQEQHQRARGRLHREASKCDRALCVDPGTTNKMLYRVFGGSVEECRAIAEIEDRIRLVIKWRTQGGYE